MIVEGQGESGGAADSELLALLARHGYTVRSQHFGNALNWVLARDEA
jgi:hypothetical protein